MNRTKDEQEFYEELPRETRDALEKILKTAEENLPAGFEMRYGEGVISYVVPLSLYPTFPKSITMVELFPKKGIAPSVFLLLHQ